MWFLIFPNAYLGGVNCRTTPRQDSTADDRAQIRGIFFVDRDDEPLGDNGMLAPGMLKPWDQSILVGRATILFWLVERQWFISNLGNNSVIALPNPGHL